MITAVLIDRREPEWVKRLKFGGVPVSVTELDAGDIWAVTNDGHTLMIERKTPDDLLGTLRDERLFPQLARLAQRRLDQQASGAPPTYWPYLLITGELQRGANGKVISDRGETGWSWAAIQGALLSVQEMGVFVTYCGGDSDLEAAVERLGRRKRSETMDILPPRPPAIVSPQAAFLAALPGIGTERVSAILQWAGGNLAHALWGLTDTEVDGPVPIGARRRIRRFMGLKANEELTVMVKGENHE